MSKKQHHHEPRPEKETEFIGPHDEEQLQEEETSAQEEKTPDYYDQFVRLTAEFENFRKRTEREKAALLAYGKKDFAEKLLPAYEVLLRQQAKLQPNQMPKQTQDPMSGLWDGLNMVLGELTKIFQSEGIEKMDVVGKPYDPQTAEAIAVIPAKPEQDGQVLEEVQMGFMMDGKVLRPARVVVGKVEEQQSSK